MNEFRHIRLDRVSSTNEFAAFLASKTNPVEGTVISSVAQYAGRGQVGRYWHASPDQNITMSVILYPKSIKSIQQFDLNKILALSIVSVLSSFLPNQKIQIKWPNDIYIEEKKIAGLLIQISTMGKEIRSAVFGIGLNLYETHFPGDIPNPVSLIEFLNEFPSIPELIQLIWKQIMDYYQLYQNGGRFEIAQNYLERLYKYREFCLFTTIDGELLRGSIEGVDEIGKLIVSTPNGMRTFAMSEIKMKTDL